MRNYAFPCCRLTDGELKKGISNKLTNTNKKLIVCEYLMLNWMITVDRFADYRVAWKVLLKKLEFHRE